ncbi:MAG TPA: alkaline phosphatase family protein [Baekduia sp.]|uniref:alkaline phosphatase family protein n=1 Tax=Baekduia sp. TaxID=2600305 RepID=UPI002C3D306C|nr:alkaline phosphatase family protein [Baekduia sp.]HMJ36233.1 alkaline phosphatase family protein [Baekduia sp.]
MHARCLAPTAVVAMLALTLTGSAAAQDQRGGNRDRGHIVVIYQENHSFDNLYGGWEGVNGIDDADAAHSKQVAQDGTPYDCLLQNDVNLTSPDPLPATCSDATTAKPFVSHFPNEPFQIDDYIKPTDTTCPAPGVFAANGVKKGTGEVGGCTRDLVHRFYTEQYQLDGGRQDRYTTGSDADGLTQGYYDTRSLPIYRYLHAHGHPPYAIADNFFQAAFGGSFLNHQWLVAAATPVFANAVQDAGADDLHSRVDGNGMAAKTDHYTPTAPTKDAQLTSQCADLPTPDLLCGDYAVNTIQPWDQPFAPGTADSRRLPPLTNATIGDRLSDAGVDWAWYSGGWSNANGDEGAPGWSNGHGPTCTDPATLANATFPNCPDKLFQFHHQPLAYFKSFAAGTEARRQHLRDEQEFLALAGDSRRECRLKAVSFIKPIGAENEHPGYASEAGGSDHLVDLLKAIRSGRCAKDTMIVVTYDEFGGQWDHVTPPGQAGGPDGPSDQSGPGTRIPALVLAPQLRHDFAVDHTSHDTTSVLSTIEQRYGLEPLSSRDAAAAPLTSAFDAPRAREDGGRDR